MTDSLEDLPDLAELPEIPDKRTVEYLQTLEDPATKGDILRLERRIVGKVQEAIAWVIGTAFLGGLVVWLLMELGGTAGKMIGRLF